MQLKKLRRLFMCHYGTISTICHYRKKPRIQWLSDPKWSGPHDLDLISYYNLHCGHTGPFAASRASQVGSCLRTFAHCSLCLGCSSSDICLAQSLTSFNSFLVCSLFSEASAGSFLKNFNSVLKLPPAPIPNHPYSALFSPKNTSPKNVTFYHAQSFTCFFLKIWSAFSH